MLALSCTRLSLRRNAIAIFLLLWISPFFPHDSKMQHVTMVVKSSTASALNPIISSSVSVCMFVWCACIRSAFHDARALWVEIDAFNL